MADNPSLVTGDDRAALPDDVVPCLVEVDFSGQTTHAAAAILMTASGSEGSRSGTLVDSSNPLPITLPSALPAGDNNIGNVDVVTMPALAAGTNNIGDVDVLTLPADPLGANADSVVAAGAAGSISAKLRRLTTDTDSVKTAVEIVDDWDESDRAKVNLIVGQAGVAAGSGTVGATVIRTAEATDSQLSAGIGATGDAAITQGSTGSVSAKLRTRLQQEAPNTATLANVSTSTASATLQASNTGRLDLTIYNDATTVLYVKYGTTASATSFTVAIDPGGFWRDPTGYTGRVDGILASGSGTARMTELTYV